MVDVQHQVKHNLISRRISQIPPSGIRRFFDILSSLEGVISLGIGEPDFTTPWHIRESAIYSLERGNTMYTSNLGLLELREELACYLRKSYGLKYDPCSEILITVGVSEALDLTLRALIDPGDEVILSDPSYVAYEPCIILSGGVPVFVPTDSENQFRLDPVEIERRITPNTKAILISYPSNPTGAVMPREGLLELAAIAEQHDLLVISDEIYSSLVYGVEHTCFASLPGMRKRTVLLGGFSKAYAMTGWRVGYAAASAEIIQAMTRIHQYAIMCVPTMGQVAAVEALRAGDAEVNRMVSEYDQRRRVMVKGLNNLGLPCIEPQGAFYAFPSVKRTGLSSDEFAERLLREGKVAVVPGSVFGKCGEGYIRCCYATSIAEINEALMRMKYFVEKFHI